ncbi:tyrosine/DOPA decarboxylase [Spatholobus suberectus]|nr:tyrosine/DOPA decarboxylase [Spatholobus suberectus]
MAATQTDVLDLLKCSLLSKSSLTDLFLEKKLILERSRIINVQIFKAHEHKSDVAKFRSMYLTNPESPAKSPPEGFVKEPSMYVATDDLVVAPFSPILALNLRNRLNTPFNDLKEKVVTIGLKECLGILKASLTSTSTLTNGLGHLLTEVKEEK